MKVKLAVASAVLLFASTLSADEIQTDQGVLCIPDGSTVTAIQEVNNGFYLAVTISFTFADGSGEAQSQGSFGAQGYIDFTTPVEDVDFGWAGDIFAGSDNQNDAFNSFGTGEANGTAFFASSGITSIGWGTYSDLAPAGISSLSYALDPVPEPSSLLLSGIGLGALIGLACRHRAKGRKAMA